MRYLAVFIFLVLLMGCKTRDCSQLPSTFQSYSEAENTIYHTHFVFKDKVNTAKSSWIAHASYYSCDKQTRFFILETDSRTYFFQDVPMNVWQSFKKAPSFGTFYNRFIRNKYQMQLKEK